MIALDLFAGAGGLSLGLQRAGFTVAAAIEQDRDAATTYAAAHPDVHVMRTSVEEVDFSPWRDGIDLLAGGPPCQPFSTGGKRLGKSDPRDAMPAMLDAIRIVRPRAVLIENVAGLASAKRRPYFLWLLAALEAQGYSVASRVLDATEYGVPQHRRRLLIVGLRRGSFVVPTPTHGPGRGRGLVTVEMALRDVDPGSPNPSPVVYAKRPHVRPSLHSGLLFNGSGRPLDLHAPSPTILAIAGGNKTHFVDTRGVAERYHRHLLGGGRPRAGRVGGAVRLTLAQSAALQSFPPDMTWAGRRTVRFRQVGNAVPPLLAEAVCLQIAAALGTRAAARRAA